MIQKITLPNGLRLVYEHIPHVRSVSLGLWLGVGSRFETAAESGASHFIEHLLFKGTATRSATELAEEMDQLGGQINAFTTKECTCFYGRVLDQNLRRTVDLLADIFLRSRFSDADIEAEQKIISEEIDMYEDSPEDLVSDVLIDSVFAPNALSMPVLGTKASLAGLTRDSLLTYKSAHYTPGRLVIAISGNFTEADLDYIRTIFAAMPPGSATSPEAAIYTPGLVLRKKSIEQNHLCLLLPGLATDSEDRYAGQLLNNILGGGISSRLFQTVREQHGLCYNVYSFGVSFQELGLLGVYAALGSETEEKALGLILAILRDLRDKGVTPGELDRARDQVKSNILMSLESTSARMNTLGKNELTRGHIPTPEETITRYDAVTLDSIRTLAERLIDFNRLSFSAVGEVADEAKYRKLLSL
ncbi:MAG: insulinase family protein [Oscillospiraceae bacterium]|nr:insulinase family protein [Oscillospiraceae bacterium]